jgi:hypothetical protein
MIVHRCSKCEKISINRLAADDDEGAIIKTFVESKNMSEDKKKIFADSGIRILGEGDKEEVYIQLFGKGGYF